MSAPSGAGAGAGAGTAGSDPQPPPPAHHAHHHGGGGADTELATGTSDNDTSKLHTAMTVQLPDECMCLPSASMPCDNCEMGDAVRRCNMCSASQRFVCWNCDVALHSTVVKHPHTRLQWNNEGYSLPPLEMCDPFPSRPLSMKCVHCGGGLVKDEQTKGTVAILTNRTRPLAHCSLPTTHTACVMPRKHPSCVSAHFHV